MKVIGITGNSGAGKTTVCEIMKNSYEVNIIDADKVAKSLSKKGTAYLKAIENTFGTEIIKEDGNLNRNLLAKKIYENHEDRNKLNNLTFIYVVDEIKNILKQNEGKINIVDAPLLFEAGLEKICDKVITVVATQELKIKRICERDGLDIEVAKSRLKIQNDEELYIDKSDFVIRNNGSREDLENQIKNIMNEIL